MIERVNILDGIDSTHWTGHILSLLAMLGSLVGYLPALAGGAAFTWYLIQIWESQTFQKFLLKHRSRIAVKHMQQMQQQKERLERDLADLQKTVKQLEQSNGHSTPTFP